MGVGGRPQLNKSVVVRVAAVLGLRVSRHEVVHLMEVVLADVMRGNVIPDSMVKHLENFNEERKGR